jgi:hypothetical protein
VEIDVAVPAKRHYPVISCFVSHAPLFCEL